MALRIGGGRPPVPQDENLNLHASDEGDAAAAEMQEPAAEETSETPDQESAEGAQGGALDQSVAGYKGPEQGPFKCGNCVHYGVNGPGTCEIVSGQIDQEGLCNVFTSASGGHQDLMQMEDMSQQPEEMPQEAPPEEQPPTEQAY